MRTCQVGGHRSAPLPHEQHHPEGNIPAGQPGKVEATQDFGHGSGLEQQQVQTLPFGEGCLMPGAEGGCWDDAAGKRRADSAAAVDDSGGRC